MNILGFVSENAKKLGEFVTIENVEKFNNFAGELKTSGWQKASAKQLDEQFVMFAYEYVSIVIYSLLVLLLQIGVEITIITQIGQETNTALITGIQIAFSLLFSKISKNRNGITDYLAVKFCRLISLENFMNMMEKPKGYYFVRIIMSLAIFFSITSTLIYFNITLVIIRGHIMLYTINLLIKHFF